MAREPRNNGRNWYAMISALLILAVVGWCVAIVSKGSGLVYANKEKIAVQAGSIDGIKEDVREIKADVKELLRRR